MATPLHPARPDVERAVLAAVKRMGVRGVNKAAIAAEFEGRASRAAVYRWITETLRSDKPGKLVARQVRAVKAAHAAKAVTCEAAAAGAAAAVAALPLTPDIDELLDLPIADMMAKLGTVLAVNEELVQHGRDAEGRPRNVGLMLKANERVLATISTCFSMMEKMQALQQMETFKRIVMDALRRASPEVAAQVQVELRQAANGMKARHAR